MANEPTRDTTAGTLIAFSESILIVDDDVVVREMLCRLLERSKYVIHEAGDAKAH
jgi:CheY-like chemotaxis protein